MREGRLRWPDLGARPALFPSAAFAAGVWWGSGCGPESAFLLLSACLVALLAIALRGRTGAHLLALSAYALAGVGLSGAAARVFVPPEVSQLGVATVEGQIEELRAGEPVQRLTLRVSRVIAPVEADARFRLRLYPRDGPLGSVAPGQRIRVPVRMRPIDPPLNPGQPDLRARMLRSGTAFSGTFDAEAVLPISSPPPSARWLEQERRGLAELTRRWAPSPDAAALYLTLAAGLRAELSDELEERFSASGLAHVLSVSGLHVAVLAVFLLWALRWLGVRLWRGAHRIDVRRLAAPAAVPLLWGYVAFTQNQLPAVRSAVMASAVLLAMAAWRRPDALNALAIAALAVLAIDPPAIADLSTQLSFLAVASLIVVVPALRRAVPIPRPDPGAPRGWARTAGTLREAALSTALAGVAVTIATGPLIAATFGRLSLAGIASNVVCLPLCGALAVLAAGGAAAHVVWPPLAVPFAVIGGWGSELLLWAVEVFAALPGASIPLRAPSATATLFVLLGLFGWALAAGRWRAVGLLAPAGVLLAVAPPGWVHWRGEPGLSVTFLSVGHGDAIVLSSRGHHGIVDGGGSVKGLDPGRRTVLPFLRERGIDALELAVLSHPHPDHALGLASVLERVPTRRLWLPAGNDDGELVRRVLAAAGRAETSRVQAGHPPLPLGDARVEVLAPPVDRVLLEGVNDRSAVLRVRHGEVTFLLAGDVEAAAEETLDPGEITVLKVPHHGSRTSSTEAFVGRTRPRFAVFCVGRGNRFGFPAEEVLARYEAAGAACYRTDLDGAITFESDGRSVRVRTFLQPPAGETSASLAHGRRDRHSSPE